MNADILALPGELRRILRPILPERAFLMRGRGDCAFVTDAPRFAKDFPDLGNHLRAAGFLVREEGGRMTLSPGGTLLSSFERAHPDPAGFFSQTLKRFRDTPPCPDAVTLFAVGVRLLEHAAPGEQTVYNRRARQLAALCLRKNLGGAYACGLILDTLERRSTQ